MVPNNETDTNIIYPGEILFASSYGGLEDYTFANSIAVTPAWLEAVKEQKAVLSETNNLLWLDFELNTALVINIEDGVDPFLRFARRYCYKRFTETFCGYFGMTEIFGFLYRIFSEKHKERPDEYDKAYAILVDSILQDVRFIVCIRRRESSPFKESEHVESVTDATERQVESLYDDFSEEFSRIQKKTEYSTYVENVQEPPARVRNNSSMYKLTYVDDDYDNLMNDEIRPISESTPIKGSVRRRVFDNSPMPGDTVPDSFSQDDFANSTMEIASSNVGTIMETTVGEDDNAEKRNVSDQMPLFLLYDTTTKTEKVLNYESDSDRKKEEYGKNNTFVIDGLYDEPAPGSSRKDDSLIEITYAVRTLRDVLSFTAICVFNGYLKCHGDRGRIRFELEDFIRTIRSLDCTARLVDSEHLDLWSFEVDLSSLQIGSLLKRQRKLFFRFIKCKQFNLL